MITESDQNRRLVAPRCAPTVTFYVRKHFVHASSGYARLRVALFDADELGVGRGGAFVAEVLA